MDFRTRRLLQCLSLLMSVALLDVAHALEKDKLASIKTVGRIIEECNAIAITRTIPTSILQLFAKPRTSTDYLYVGQLVSGVYSLVKVDDNLYASKISDSFALSLTPDGKIKNIMVMGDGLFTQRYIVIGESTLADVIERYDQPPSREFTSDKSVMILNYPERGMLFAFKGKKSDSKRSKPERDSEQYSYDPRSTMLESITLKARNSGQIPSQHCGEFLEQQE